MRDEEVWTLTFEDFDGSTTKELVEGFANVKGLRTRTLETSRGKLGIFYVKWSVCPHDLTVLYKERRRLWLTGKEAGRR